MNQNRTFESLQIKEMQIRNYSPRTIKTYCSLLIKLEKELGKSLYEITTEDFKNWLHYLIKEKGFSASTLNQLISAFKIFHVDVCHRKWEEFHVRRPRKEKKLPVILSLQEVQRMITVTKNIKHKAILMLTYSAGLRRMEVLQIKPRDIDSQRMQVRIVQGKGKKDRYTILSWKTLEVLRTYYKSERPTTYLFEPMGRKGQPLSERTVEYIVRNCPKCQYIKQMQWVDKLASNLPPVKHFHIVFTIPSCLHKLFYINQQIAYSLLFKAAGQTLMQCAKNTRYLGAETGSVALLHTWGQTMTYHPHIHTIVPAGGLSDDGME